MTCFCCVLFGSFIPKPVETPIPPATTNTQAATVLTSRCVPASAAQIEIIRAGIKGVDTNNDIGTAWAVKTNDFAKAWFVAGSIQGPGINPGDAIGLWALGGELETPSAGALSVNSFALQFSDWADGPKSDAHLSTSNDGAQEALNCVK